LRALTAFLRLCQNSQGQLAHLDQLITLLMINKKHIVSSDQMRKEVIPKLNLLQIKQVLAMYTPTGTRTPPSFHAFMRVRVSCVCRACACVSVVCRVRWV